MSNKIALISVIIFMLLITGCPKPDEQATNPWLVPFQERHSSMLSRSQMRAMVRLGDIYNSAGMEKEYVGALTTAVELYAGDQNVTFELINALIEDINELRSHVAIDPSPARKDELEAQYEELLRIMRTACNQIPYNAELYYRTASLQYLRAEEDGDEDKYKDAINYLKRAIASDSGHLESYHLIAVCYERLEDNERALRFWKLFEVIYEIAPQVMGDGFIDDQRRQLHQDALARIEALEASGTE
ncbi:MAG TPA: hypothetical protein VGB30_05235 [bacterium]